MCGDPFIHVEVITKRFKLFLNVICDLVHPDCGVVPGPGVMCLCASLSCCSKWVVDNHSLVIGGVPVDR